MPVTTTAILHLYIHQPTAIFKARLNLAGATYPLTTLPFDGVTLGAFGDIAADQTLTLGSADGLDDYGRVRVQNIATSTNIPVGRVSQGYEDGTLQAVDNAYITVFNDFRVWAKLPYITAAGVSYKDSDVAIGTFTTLIPPVANCGPGTAGTINAGTSLLTVAFDGTASYAMADGATITTYAWDLQGGTVTVGTLASATLTATFPAGFRWVALTVTDSNSKSHSARCPVLAVNPAADVTVENFQVESHRIMQEGQTLGFRVLEDVPRTTYPDGCLVMYWWNEPASASDRTHMKFIGWHQSDSVNMRAQQTGLLRDTVLHCVDVAGRLAALPGFPQALERVTPATTWEHMPGLTIDKCLHYLAFWHSTALGLADFIRSGIGNNYPAMRLDSTGASLYEQINGRAKSMVPDHFLTCNTLGQLRVIADWMLKDVADRPAATATITEDYWSDIRFEYNRPPRVHVLRASAVVASTAWLVLGGENTLPLAFSIAPGDAFSQGTAESTHGEQLTISQATLNACTGHRYARLNARYGLLSISEPSGSISVWGYEPANMARVTLNISAATAAQRGLDFTTANGMIKAIDLRYNHTKQGTWISPTIQWEREVIGLPAVTHVPEVPEDPDYETPAPPPATSVPDFGLIGGQQLVAGIGSDGYVYRTSDFQTVSGSGGPTWTRVNTTIAATIYSFVVDPFSPGYIAGAGAINGWIVNDTGIYKVTDLFGSATATLVHTFTTVTVAASYHWRSIQASFGTYFAEGINPWLMCVSYYGTTSGHTGTWATYSTNGGVTWATEVQVSANADTATATGFNPIGVYASPKTSGLAYTAAHTAAADTAAAPLPHWGVINAGVFIRDIASPTVSLNLLISVSDNETADSGQYYLLVAPPTDAVRVKIKGFWSETRSHNNAAGGSGYTGSISNTNGANAGVVTDTLSKATGATQNGPALTQDFVLEYTRNGGQVDWENSRDDLASSPPTAPTGYLYVSVLAGASCTGSRNAIEELNINMTIVEIELEGGAIYAPAADTSDGFVSANWGASWAAVTLPDIRPGAALAGSIHLPWPSNSDEQLVYHGSYDGSYDGTTNRKFRLKRVQGATITDISPVASAINYGVNHFGFSVRSYDNDRQYVAVGGIGNDTSTLRADDKVGLWVSTNAGTAWVNILAPVAATNALHGLQIAFGGDSSSVLFAWGGWSNAASLAAIYYSSDGGTVLDSREGNINSLGTTAFIGIAGGPG